MSDRSRRRPWLAALLAIVVSGLGHAYLRRWGRALGWYVAVTATLVLVVPDAAVEQLIAGERPQLVDIAPAILVLAASVIDAYVLARRSNRELDRGDRVIPESASGQTDSEASTGERSADESSGRMERSAADAEADTTVTACPHCGRETDPAFDFCQWCAEPVDG